MDRTTEDTIDPVDQAALIQLDKVFSSRLKNFYPEGVGQLTTGEMFAHTAQHIIFFYILHLFSERSIFI